MTDRELLEAHRDAIIELQALTAYMHRQKAPGSPSGCRSQRIEGSSPSTNDTTAAAMQLADGLDEQIARIRRRLDALAPEYARIVSGIFGCRLLVVISRYYGIGDSEEAIALALHCDRSTVGKIRRAFLADLDRALR